MLSLAPMRSSARLSLAAASPSKAITSLASVDVDMDAPLTSLASILRPAVRGNWLMPYMSAITPQYIESILRGGIMGNHIQAYQLFDLMWDSWPELHSCIDEYIQGVTGKKWTVTAYQAGEDEEPTDLAVENQQIISGAFRSMRPDAAAFELDLRGIIKSLLAARFHSQSVLEVDWYNTWTDGQLYQRSFPGLSGTVTCPRAAYWVNPTCYAYDAMGRLGLVIPKTQLRTVGSQLKNNPTLSQSFIIDTTSDLPEPRTLTPFPDNKFLIGIDGGKVGSALSSSDLRCLAFFWCCQNFCGDYLMTAAQLFGVPFRKATYSSSVTEPQKAEVRQMLQSVGSTGWAFVPEGVVLDFERATTSGGQSPQAFLFNLCESICRKVILHQTMSGGMHGPEGKGGGGAFGEVESDTKDDCIDDGARFVEGVINTQFIPQILRVNRGVDGDDEAPVFSLVDDEQGNLNDAQIITAMAQQVDIPASYVRKLFGFPKPADDDAIAGIDEGILGEQAEQQQQQQQAQMDAQQQQAKMQAEAMANQDDGEDEDDEPVNAANAKNPLSAADAATAFADAVAPMTDRLKAIDAIEDVDAKKAALKKFLADQPAMAKAIRKDSGFADAVTAQGIASFVSGLRSKVIRHQLASGNADQPRDYHGRWADESDAGASGEVAESGSDKPSADALAMSKKLGDRVA